MLLKVVSNLPIPIISSKIAYISKKGDCLDGNLSKSGEQQLPVAILMIGEKNMDIKKKNQIYLGVFCCIIGAFASAVIWLFLKAVAVGTTFLWEWLPDRIHLPFYSVLICTAGGMLIGIFRKMYGDYPEDLAVVMGKVKKEKHYEYKKMPAMLIAAFLPLILGGSIGPEAGMTGIIVGLCYWAGDNLKFARENAKEYSEVGIAVTLSLLFHSPLFGIFSVEEENKEKEIIEPAKTSKMLLYGLALAAGTGVYLLLSDLFGAAMEGFPSFPVQELERIDYLMIFVYILCGCILARFYHFIHEKSHSIAEKIPPVLRESLGGFCLGAVGLAVPAVMFSGEAQMEVLMEHHLSYLPLWMIGAAFLKVMLTNLCIQFGLKGGHFFPVIFAGACLGYGIAGFVFPGDSGHVVLAAAVTTAALLGGIMKKPLAVTVLLFLCFPIKMFIWIFVSAAIGSKAA